MPKPSKKPEPVLLPENERTRPVNQPWLWVAILLVGGLVSVWRMAIFDEDAVRKHRIEVQQQIELEKQGMTDPNGALMKRLKQGKNKNADKIP